MMQEYYRWCELNPNATEEEKKGKMGLLFQTCANESGPYRRIRES